MNAVEFVKKFGIDVTKESLNKALEMEGSNIEKYKFLSCIVIVSELKQIVQAFELVESYGGLDEAKDELFSRNIGFSKYHEMQKSIKLVEQCQ